VLVKRISMSSFFKPYSQARISPAALMDMADWDTDNTPSNREEFPPP
jgi:hypothetical protein